MNYFLPNLKMLNPGISCFKIGVLIPHASCKWLKPSLKQSSFFEKSKSIGILMTIYQTEGLVDCAAF